MEFHAFAVLLNARFNDLASSDEVFHVNCSRDDLWNTYIESFPPGTNPIFRERTEHDCNCCRQFIKGVGGMVAIDSQGRIQTVWDVEATGTYGVVAKAMAELVRAGDIDRIYRTQQPRYGAETSREISDSGNIVWNHFWADIPARLITADVGTVQGTAQAAAQVLGRGLQELSLEALEIVTDLIDSNSIYRGQEFQPAVEGFKTLKTAYMNTAQDLQKNFVWANINARSARFRNTVIGTLVDDISGGMELIKAVKRFESKVAPAQYKRSSAPITKVMVEKALTEVRELGLESALKRRFAVISDVAVGDVLFANREVRTQMKDDLTDLLMEEVKPAQHTIKDLVTISAEDFFADILPGAAEVKLKLDNQHLSNFMSLTAPVEDDVGQLFSWENNFAWAYDGNVTDSIKERVKAAGGNVDALLRISLGWHNGDDLDIHAQTPTGKIYYGNRQGILDVDMNAGGPSNKTNPVENLSWNRVADGDYSVWVHQYSKRNSTDVGFEIQYAHSHDNRLLSYPKGLRGKERVDVCSFKVKNGQVQDLRFNTALTGSETSVEKWGVKTGDLIPVDTVMLSPNHWGPEDKRQGNKHHLFVLRGCKNPNPIRGIFNEFLRPGLTKHRKVFEVLGGKLKCTPTEEQLSGVGFSSTRKDTATFVVQKDDTIRTYKVQF